MLGLIQILKGRFLPTAKQPRKKMSNTWQIFIPTRYFRSSPCTLLGQKVLENYIVEKASICTREWYYHKKAFIRYEGHQGFWPCLLASIRCILWYRNTMGKGMNVFATC